MRTISFLLATTLILFFMPTVSIGGVPDISVSECTPASPLLVSFDENLCEADWLNVTYAIANPNPSYEYIWNIPAEIIALTDISDNGDRILVSDIGPLLANPIARIYVQAKDDCGESFPTVLNVKLIPQLEIAALPRDTFCVDRAERIDPYRTNVDAVDAWDWNFGVAGEVTTGEPDTGDEFFVKYNAEGTFIYTQTVTDTFGCATSQSYDIDVFNAPPLPSIVPCPYQGMDSVFFAWTIDPAYEYETLILPLPPGAMIEEQTDTSLLVTGLTPGQSVIVTVTATTDNSPAPCDVATQTIQCRSCLPAAIDFSQINRINFCVGDVGNFPVPLLAEVNATNRGVATNPAEGAWDTTADGVVVQGTDVFFDPDGLAPGIYAVDYEYIHPDDDCPWTSQVSFNIYERPFPNASLDKDRKVTEIEICSDEEVLVYFDRFSTLPRPDIFFNGGNGGVMNEAKSKDVERFTFPSDEATYEIIVRYQIPDCEPISDTLMVMVNPKPEITIECGPIQSNAVSVEWSLVEDTNAYDIYLNGTFYSTVENDNKLTIGALDVANTYEIIVEALALGCGAIRDTAYCETGACVAPTVDLSAIEDAFCYDPLVGPIPLIVEVTPATANILGQYAWDTNGSGTIEDDTLFMPELGIEEYLIDLLYEDELGCTFTIEEDVQITVVTAPVANLVVDGPDTICITAGAITVYSDFQAVDATGFVVYTPTWPAGVNATETVPGEYLVTFDDIGEYTFMMDITYKDCTGPTAMKTMFIEPKPEITLDCGPEETNSVSVEWTTLDGTNSYDIYLDGDLYSTVENDNQLTIENLDINNVYEIIVQALDIGCGAIVDTVYCRTGGCIEPTFDISAITDPICYDPLTGPISIAVDVTPVDASIQGEYSWDTKGLGTLDTDNLFTPDAGVEEYLLDLLYTDDTGCDFVLQEDVLLTIVDQPVANLLIDGPDTLCFIDAATRVYSDFQAIDPLGAVVYTPTWPAGVNATENAPGDYSLTFDEGGEYMLIMEVTYKDCTGPTDTTMIVIEPMLDLGLNCGPQQSESLSVEWMPLNGAPSYDVYLDGVFYSTVENDNQVTIDALELDSTYQVIVEATDIRCGLVRDTIMCSTRECFSPTADVSALSLPFCFIPSDGSIQLTADVTPVPNLAGDYTWDTNGSGTVDSDNRFTPEEGVEEYLIDLLYEDESGCTFILEENIPITVVTEPTANLIVDSPDTICITAAPVIVYSDFQGLDPSGLVVYTPTWPSGVNATETAPGEYELTFEAEGEYTFMMDINYKGCTGPTSMATIRVEPDIDLSNIICTPGFGHVTLDWDPIDCVTSYEVTVNGLLPVSGSGTEREVGPLEGGTMITYTVKALSNCLCPDAEFTGTCEVLVCPEIVIEPLAIDTCWNPTLPAFELPINVTPSALLPMGIGELTGTLVNSDGLVDISAAFDEENEFEYTYTQGYCSETQISTLTLNQPPTLDSIQTFMPECADDDLGMVIVNVREGTGTPDYQYSIDNGQNYQIESTFMDVPVGPVFVTVIDASGCVLDGLAEVFSPSDPSMTVSGPDLVVEGNEAIFTISSDIDRNIIRNIVWYLDGEIIREGIDLFEVTIEDLSAAGTISADIIYNTDCVISGSMEFDINQLQSIYIPNMVDFSGNSISPNDAWTVYIKGDEVFITKVLIYDRWGNKIKDFENKAMDYFKELLIWDGNFGSVMADQGVYTYVIEVVIEGRTEIKRGSITVLR